MLADDYLWYHNFLSEAAVLGSKLSRYDYGMYNDYISQGVGSLASSIQENSTPSLVNSSLPASSVHGTWDEDIQGSRAWSSRQTTPSENSQYDFKPPAYISLDLHLNNQCLEVGSAFEYSTVVDHVLEEEEDAGLWPVQGLPRPLTNIDVELASKSNFESRESSSNNTSMGTLAAHEHVFSVISGIGMSGSHRGRKRNLTPEDRRRTKGVRACWTCYLSRTMACLTITYLKSRD